jgi:fumarate hydratase class II
MNFDDGSRAVCSGLVCCHDEREYSNALSSRDRRIPRLSDAMVIFELHCVRCIQPNQEHIAMLMRQSLMLATALNPQIGNDKAAQIAKHAHATGLMLKEAAAALGHVTAEQFDLCVSPLDTTRPAVSADGATHRAKY